MEAVVSGTVRFDTAPVEAAPGGGQTTITAVRFGRHDGFDRVVFDVDGPMPGFRVEYVPGLRDDQTGDPIPLAGAADVRVVIQPTTWIDTPSPVLDVRPELPALRQVRSAGEFEGCVVYGIGQASKAGFRAYPLTGPNRIVVDVKHPWIAG